MLCCGDMSNLALSQNDIIAKPSWIQEVGKGIDHMDLLVPGIHCAGCIQKIENRLMSLAGVARARVNLSSKRISIDWKNDRLTADDIIGQIEGLGFTVQPFVSGTDTLSAADKTGRELLRALAVSGFAATNIMLLSVSVWSGATEATRDLFHWISALIALPAVVFAGQPFFSSAWTALKARQMNMDVPISLGVIMASALSLFETINRQGHAYFDAAVMLLFFLLIGRYLDHMMREKARSAVSHLLSLTPQGAKVVGADGYHSFQALDQIETGMRVFVSAGERIPVDGTIIKGQSDVDMSVITGETAPETMKIGSQVFAGALNLTGPMEIRVTSVGSDTLLAEMVRLMEAAEQSKAHYVRLSNKVAKIYAPVIHVLALASFLGWMFYTGGDWHQSIIIAICVLIITCPCALGLAVPVVQIVAAGVLFRNGVMVKDGAALEKLAQVDTVMFDKTGTLTLGKPRLISVLDLSGQEKIEDDDFILAASLAQASHHPLSRAVLGDAQKRGIVFEKLEQISETPGSGMQGYFEGKRIRLGNRLWCEVPENVKPEIAKPLQTDMSAFLELCLQIEGGKTYLFYFEDELKKDAKAMIQELQNQGTQLGIMSGDRLSAVRHVAENLSIIDFHAGLKPQDKVGYLKNLNDQRGRKVMMVGDGLNDAPALAAGFTSMAPSSASDVGRMAADFVFLGDALRPVAFTQKIAKAAHRAIIQNFALAIIYNLIAVPIAILGYATPLVAALAMSSSSIIVVVNALKLRLMDRSTVHKGAL